MVLPPTSRFSPPRTQSNPRLKPQTQHRLVSLHPEYLLHPEQLPTVPIATHLKQNRYIYHRCSVKPNSEIRSPLQRVYLDVEEE